MLCYLTLSPKGNLFSGGKKMQLTFKNQNRYQKNNQFYLKIRDNSITLAFTEVPGDRICRL